MDRIHDIRNDYDVLGLHNLKPVKPTGFKTELKFT